MNMRGLRVLSRILQGVIWISVGVMALGTIVVAIILVAPGLFETVNVIVPMGFDVEGTAGSLTFSGGAAPIEVSHAVGYFNLPGQSRGLVLILWVFIALGIGISVGAETSFKRLVDSAARGEPFGHGNARRVRQLGWLSMATGILQTLYLVATYLYTARRLQSEVITASVRVDVGVAFIVVGILLLVLGGVFDRGEELQRDHDLTV